MKRLLVVFVVLLTFQAVALASPKNIDLREYQQATGTINVLAAPFENDNFYLATFNFDEQNKGDKVNFYQGTCIVDKENQKVLQPLLVKRIIGSEDKVSEVVLNKRQENAIFAGFLETVQNKILKKPKVLYRWRCYKYCIIRKI